MHPVDAVVAADGVHHRVEAVADHPVHPPHPGGEKDLDELVGDGALGHDDLHDPTAPGRAGRCKKDSQGGCLARVARVEHRQSSTMRLGGQRSPRGVPRIELILSLRA
jgi:hypothetical protein